MSIKNVSLEMSLKPFYDNSSETIDRVCTTLFQQWTLLCKQADQISILLWIADGSEILDYSGNLADNFEWARYIGGANPREEINSDAEQISLHSRCYLYRQNPAEFTYGWLKNLVKTLKTTGSSYFGKPVRVGATFDPGPEFAKSDFKYKYHNEICFSDTMGPSSFVSCYGILKGDQRHYAGFPSGIEDGTPFGQFFGRQSQLFLSDLDFDYIWFSNGFGFGIETWKCTGAVFDGKEFKPDKCEDIRKRILEFWRLFREECHDFPIETRGTNLSTAMDLSSDAVPLDDIYKGDFNMVAPVNSPWAALNGDFGMELIGWMSHIAGAPADKGFPYRFYTHDPWWLNSPWLDRYAREPHDIYLPLSVARINEDGGIDTPDSVAILSVDDSYGKMPDQVPNEVIPHILKGLQDTPDAPGPLVWVYPFEEYHKYTFEQSDKIDKVFFGDWFIRNAVNLGLPVNTVMSTSAFGSVVEAYPETLRSSIIMTPAPDSGSNTSAALIDYIKSGGKVLLYGPLDHTNTELVDMLQIHFVKSLEGDFHLDKIEETDQILEPEPDLIKHNSKFCAGGLECTCQGSLNDIIAKAVQGNEERVIALHKSEAEWNGGAVVWVRGTLSCDPVKLRDAVVVPYPADEVFQTERLMRYALSRLGLQVAFAYDNPNQTLPVVCIARCKNAFVFSGYVPDQLVDISMRLPAGMPLINNVWTRIESGKAVYRMPRAWHHECRVFIEQTNGHVVCNDVAPIMVGVSWRYLVKGLKNATVRFFPVPGTEHNISMLRNPHYPYTSDEVVDYIQKDDNLGHYVQAHNVSGDLLISWQEKRLCNVSN